MEPSGTCFVSNLKGYFALEEPLNSLQQESLLNAFDRYADNFTIYDEKGLRWKTNGFKKPVQRHSWLLFPFTVLCSPWISVTYIWSEPTEYSLDELKAAYIRAVEMDDDILTQFVGAVELEKRIHHAHSFSELAEVYRWMRTDHSFDGEDEDAE
jgi:hypothetical protein